MRVERSGDRYLALEGDRVLWSVELAIDMSSTPFREELIWPVPSLVAIGGGSVVHFLAKDSGAIIKTLGLEGDLFGHFGEQPTDALYVLGWRHVVALDRSLNVRWTSKNVAVDGITWRGQEGQRILLSAEMDPPGGWVDVELDASSGNELSRAVSPPRA